MNTNNLLPFDWEIAQKQPERVVTRDGRKVTQLHIFKDVKDVKPVCGVIYDETFRWHLNGVYYYSGSESNKDLFLLPEVKECWVNVYWTENGFAVTSPFSSKHEAEINNGYSMNCIKTIRITNEPE